MKEKIISIITSVIGVILIWSMLSVLASGILSRLDNCDKDYVIGYVLQTHLFCEVRNE